MIVKSDVPAPLAACLDALAFERGTSRSALICAILADHLSSEIPRLTALRDNIREIERKYGVLPGVAAAAYFAPVPKSLPPLPIEKAANQKSASHKPDRLTKIEIIARRAAERQPTVDYLKCLVPTISDRNNRWKIAAAELNAAGNTLSGRTWDATRARNFYKSFCRG